MNNRTKEDAARRVTNARLGSLVNPEKDYLLELHYLVQDWLQQIDLILPQIEKKPQYVHDCKKCVYCVPTSWTAPPGLVYCANTTNPRLASLIARASDEGHDYSCGHPPELFAAATSRRHMRWQSLHEPGS